MQKQESPWSRPDHIGIIVRDLSKAIAFYESLGMGPFTLREMNVPGEIKMYGKPTPNFTVKLAFAKVGPINIELVQPVKDAPIQQEFLDTKGEGINHIGFLTDNLDRENERLTAAGAEIILASKRVTGSASYYDTRKIGGVLLEFIQRQ